MKIQKLIVFFTFFIFINFQVNINAEENSLNEEKNCVVETIDWIGNIGGLNQKTIHVIFCKQSDALNFFLKQNEVSLCCDYIITARFFCEGSNEYRKFLKQQKDGVGVPTRHRNILVKNK